MRRLALHLAVLALAFPVAAQEISKFGERIDVRIVNVDVVVTDRKGNVIHGLTKDDFVILESDHPKTIENFYEVRGLPAQPTAERILAGSSGDAAESQRRRIVFYIDNNSLTTMRRNRLIDQMKEFVAHALRPGDEAMVASFDQILRMRQPFTEDRARITAVLDAVKGDSAGGEQQNRISREAEVEIHAAKDFANKLMFARTYAALAAEELNRSVAAAKTLLTSLAGVEGKKAVILASESFPLHPGREMFEFIDRLNGDASNRGVELFRQRDTPDSLAARQQRPGEKFGRPLSGSSQDSTFQSAMLDAGKFDAKDQIAALAKIANANAITLYPLHGGELSGGEAGSTERGAGTSTNSIVAIGARANTAHAMQVMAEMTGGVASTGSNHQAAFARIRNDLDSFYSLGYRAADGVVGERQLKVRLKNARGYHVRARQTVLHKTVVAEMSDRVVSNLLNKPRANELNISVTASQAMMQDKGKLLIPVKIHIPYGSLTLLPDGASHSGAFDIYMVAADARGTMSPVVHRSQKVVILPGRLEQTKSETYTYSVNFLMNDDIKRVSVAIVDSATHAVSYARYDHQ